MSEYTFTLSRKHLQEEAAADIEACVEAMALLKKTERDNASVILALLTAYLQLPIEEIDPEQKEVTAEVCTSLNTIFESVRMNHLLANLKPQEKITP